MNRRASSRRQSRSAPAALVAERLEPRAMLTADIGSAVRELVWNGTPVTTRADAWILRADTPAVAVRPGWNVAPLGQGFFSVTAPGASVAEVSGWAASTAGVRYVEPDAVITTSAIPNDPSLRQLWGLNNTAQTGGVADADIDAPEAWDVATGSRSVVVAIIDTGIDYRHTDLAANVWRNPGEVAGDRIDNDGNGFIDDVYGWDFVNNDADPFDDYGHGTHVAGTIGAVGNNGVGVAGVNWQVSMMGLKFLGADGSGSTSGAIAAINYATRMRRDFGVNIVATNNSWGGGGPSTALRDAIAAGEGAGILCIAAAGNEANDNDSMASYPANYASIAVAATDASNRLASFSSYGATTVDVAAPGVSVYSTTPNNTYASYSGTSMATPHVTGLVALLAAANPQATATQIRSAILSTAVPVASLAGKVATGGLINARAALDALGGTTSPEPPAPPPTTPAPVADVIDVSPDPRTTAVSGVVVQFSTAVAGFDVGDLSLTRDGSAVSLAGVTVSTTDNVRWTVDGLATATTTAGTHVLTVVATGSGITSIDGGVPLAASASDTWVTQAAAIVDAGDTLSSAAVVSTTSGELRLSGRIGDGSFGARDVDMYRVRLAAGQTLVIDIDAASLSGGSTLDSYLRLFNSSGKEVARNDDSGGSLDSFLSYRAAVAGTFSVGISGYGNASYSPTRAGSGRSGSTGAYAIRFAFSSTAGARTTAYGARDTGSAHAAASAFAVYGANWMAALPAAPGTSRGRRSV
ncbi:MAG: S8 family serine peptidase [Planctomycetia bacterium]|nr:S8 family serine peptidase [Planctomycetia bacterium]